MSSEIIFPVGVPASISMLLLNSMYLRLTPEGSEVHLLLRTTFIHWYEVERRHRERDFKQ